MKRFLIIVLALAMLLPNFSVPGIAADESVQKDCQNELEFLGMLGVVDDIITQDGIITKAEFTHMIVKSMNMTTSAFTTSPFSDVYASTSYASSVVKAYDAGIVSGSGTGLFNPDEPINGYAAVKMAISALGYSDIAMAYGGYPTGYYKIAKEVRLLSGINVFKSSPLTTYEVINFIYNFLTADIYTISGVADGQLVYDKNQKETVLSRYHDLLMVSGICKTAGYVTMIPNKECEESVFTINGNDYENTLSDAERYLGLNVDLWFHKDSCDVIALYTHSDNQVYEIDAEDVAPYTGNLKLVADVNNREKTYTLDPSYTFVKNGRSMVPGNSDFRFDEGNFALIDNNADGRIDVVYAKEAQYMVVSYVDTVNGVIYDNSMGGKSVIAQNKDGYHFIIRDEALLGTIEAYELKDIKQDMVLTCFVSEDGKYLEAYLSKTSIKGVVSEKGYDFVIINDNKYLLNSYFGTIDKIEVGKSYRFLVASDGTITAFADTNTMNYGFVLNFSQKRTGVTDEAKLMLLTARNETDIFELAEKVILDGSNPKDNMDIAFQDTFISGSYPKYQVIGYELNSEGKINVIDTSIDLDTSATPDEIIGDKGYGNNKLTRFLKASNTRWYSYYDVFSPNALVGTNTVMFSVPYGLKDGITKQYEEKEFSAVTKADLKPYGPYIIDTYDVDMYMQPGVIVVYNPDTGSNISVAEDKTMCIVEKVLESVNEDGELTKTLLYYGDGYYYKNIIDPELCAELVKSGSIPNPGDIIRVSTNAFGEIIGLTIDATYDASKKVPKFTGAAPKNRRFDISQYAGKAFAHSSGALSLVVDPDSNPNADDTYPIVSGLAAFKVDASVKVAVFNTKTGEIRPGDMNMIKDITSAGEDNASNIIFRCYSHLIQQLYIYE